MNKKFKIGDKVIYDGESTVIVDFSGDDYVVKYSKGWTGEYNINGKLEVGTYYYVKESDLTLIDTVDSFPEKWITDNFAEVREYLATKYKESCVLGWGDWHYIGWTGSKYHNGCFGSRSICSGTYITLDQFRRFVKQENEKSSTSIKKEGLVLDKFNIGQIVVSLRNNGDCRQKGDMFKILESGLQPSSYALWYTTRTGKIVHSTDSNSWREATQAEIEAYNSGIRNINDIKKSNTIPSKWYVQGIPEHGVISESVRHKIREICRTKYNETFSFLPEFYYYEDAGRLVYTRCIPSGHTEISFYTFVTEIFGVWKDGNFELPHIHHTNPCVEIPLSNIEITRTPSQSISKSKKEMVVEPFQKVILFSTKNKKSNKIVTV